MAMEGVIQDNIGSLRVNRPEKAGLSPEEIWVDEYESIATKADLEVIRPVIFEEHDTLNQPVEIDFTDEVETEFRTLSLTRKLEINTPRTKIVQKFIDNMLEGDEKWMGKVRVVIMNKGLEPEAFVYPEGTIFVSQSLINMCDSLDELIAIMAHEVGHLTNGTLQASFKAKQKSGTTLGVSWLHEMTSDLGSAALLEKVGLKSTAMVEVMTKFAHYYDNRRGMAHQAPALRSVQLLGLHSIKDFETSHIGSTPLPKELVRDPEMRHLEKIVDALNKSDHERVEAGLSKLHPSDLWEFFQIVDARIYFRKDYEREAHRKISSSIESLIGERLGSEGYGQEEKKLFFFLHTSYHSSFEPKFRDLDELVELAPIADKMYRSGSLERISKKIFGESRTDTKDPLTELVDYPLERFDDFTNKDAVLFTDPYSFSKFLGIINRLVISDIPPVRKGKIISSDKYTDNLRQKHRGQKIYHKLDSLLYKYIERYYLPEIVDGELDQTQIEQIFRAVNRVGFQPLVHNYNFPISDDKVGPLSRGVINAAFKNVYDLDIVISESDTKARSELPALDVFEERIKNLTVYQIRETLFTPTRDFWPDSEEMSRYVEIALKDISDRDYAEYALEVLIEKSIGDDKMSEWMSAHSISTDTTEGERARKYFQGPLGSEIAITDLQLEKLMDELSLDKDLLRKEASRKGALKRMEDQIGIVCDTMFSDEERLFDFLESIMNDADYKPSDYNQYELLTACKPIIEIADRDDSSWSGVATITDYDRLYHLPFVREMVNQVESVHSEDWRALYEHLMSESDKSKSNNPFSFNSSDLYSDEVESLILGKNIRKELLRLSGSTTLTTQDPPILIAILQNYFPVSVQKESIIKQLNIHYLNNPEVDISYKIKYYFHNYSNLGIEGAVAVAEQITTTEIFRDFRRQLDVVSRGYISGENGVEMIALADNLSSIINDPEMLIKTNSKNWKTMVEVSTKMAKEWCVTYFGRQRGTTEYARYDQESEKFIISRVGQNILVSLKDMMDTLKNLPREKKAMAILKSLSDEGGLLVTAQGRRLLGKMVRESLDLKDGLLLEALKSAVKHGDTSVLSLPIAQVLAHSLFGGLSEEAVDIDHVKRAELIEFDSNYDVFSIEVGKKINQEALQKVLRSTSRDIRFFGANFRRQPKSLFAGLAKESGEDYFLTLSNLSHLVNPEKGSKLEIDGELDPNTEALIKSGESSALFVRGMQMAAQLVKFDPKVKKRLAQTQDSMKGMEKLSFWENLLSKAESDTELAKLLNDDLISLDGYLGGGSLFTTYGATIRGEGGQPKKVVIKMLNPNAEEFIRLSHELCSTVLTDVAAKNRGKVKKDALLAKSFLDLANVWCIRDINDQNYPRMDELFRKTVQAYNQKIGYERVAVPAGIITTKKVIVEEQAEGTTLNRYLADPKVDISKKREVVNAYLDFFDFQFDYTIVENLTGDSKMALHSDPHTGNYMIDPDTKEIQYTPIDRKMYLEMERRDVEMFKNLKEGRGVVFIHRFIDRCLEMSGFNGSEAIHFKYDLLNQLGGEGLRQLVSGSSDPTNYLQVITKKFAGYGERYTTSKYVGELSSHERMVMDLLRKNPSMDETNLYGKLSKEVELPALRKILSEMKEKRMIAGRRIVVPLEFQLMIRNIVAMQNLREEYVDSVKTG